MKVTNTNYVTTKGLKNYKHEVVDTIAGGCYA